MTTRHAVNAGWAAAYAVVAAVLLYLDIPLLVVGPSSLDPGTYLQFPPSGLTLRWYSALFTLPGWISSIANSLMIALGTSLCATALGTLASLGLMRTPRRVRESLMAVVLAPLVVPHIALAIGMYPLFARAGLVNTRLGVVTGHTIIAAPLVVIIVTAALQSLDPYLERAALSLGASPLNVFRHVTLPLVLPAVLGGALFAFAASFDELEIAIFLSGPTARTLPLQLWEQIQYELSPVIAVASVFIVMLFLALFAALAVLRTSEYGTRRAGRARGAAAGVETVGWPGVAA